MNPVNFLTGLFSSDPNSPSMMRFGALVVTLSVMLPWAHTCWLLHQMVPIDNNVLLFLAGLWGLKTVQKAQELSAGVKNGTQKEEKG